MSNKISALVWEQAHCGGTRKLVLLALADAANQEGWCWPSIATIARMAGCSPRRAQEHITALVKLGWVTRSPSPGRSNNYMVHAPEIGEGTEPDSIEPDAPPDENANTTISQGCEISQGSDDLPAEGCEISQGGVRNLAGGGAKSRRGGVRNLAPRTVTEPSLNPQRTVAPDPSTEKTMTPGLTPGLTPGDRPAPQLWARVTQIVAETTTPAQMASWIYPARIAAYGWDADGALCVELATPGQAHADMIDRRYSYLITDALARIYNVPASHVALALTWKSHAHTLAHVEVAP